MYVDKLCLENYRNIKKQDIKFSGGVNVISGMNAQGKTNIIESLWLFSAFKSFRTSSEKDFIRYDEDSARLKTEFFKNGRKYASCLKYSRDRRREIFVNDIKMKPGEAVGTFLSVLFFPEHLNLVKQGPEERRRFVDFALCQLKPGFLDALNRYNRILYQRNSLLKDAGGAADTLGIWDEKLASAGAIVYEGRRKYIETLGKYCAGTGYEISGGKEKFSVEYRSCCGEADSIRGAESILYKKIKEAYERDRVYGYSTVGVHKDDIEIKINGRQARFFGSQGQQRSAVLALKLAETEILNDAHGEYPVLLFDDVFSELDGSRKEYITEKIKNKQVIVTSCEECAYRGADKVFRVENGEVREV